VVAIHRQSLGSDHVWEFFEVLFIHVEVPDLDSMVGAACRKELDVGREKQSGQVHACTGMGCKDSAWKQSGRILILEHAPDVDVALRRLVRD
jgi:hypothetical protein